MRKILFLLLLTVASYGQTTTGKETKFPYGIRNQSVQTITTPTYLNTQGTDGTQGVIPSAYIEKTANKTSTISGYSETLYPNEKASHDALDLKLNISDLPTNLTLYPTTTASDVSGYVVMVKDIHDVRYNMTAVDVSTPTITTTDQLVSQRISDAGILIGQPGVFNITTFGNIRHLSGSGAATFYFKVYHRDSAGVETLICTSSISAPVTDGGYSEFTASGVWDDGDFVASDRIVIKSYANRIAGGSDPVYQFQFGGTSPVRTLLPVPFSVVDAGYELSANKQNSLAIDGTGTKYSTVDAVNAGFVNNSISNAFSMAAAGDNEFIIIGSVIARPSGTGVSSDPVNWAMISDVDHDYSFITSLSTSVSGTLLCQYPKVKRIFNFTATGDEGFIAAGTIFGSSVTNTQASISAYRPIMQGFRLLGNGTSTWTKGGTFAGNATVGAFDGAGQTIISPLVATNPVEGTGVSIDYVGQNNYRVERTLSGGGTVFYLRDVLTNTRVTTPPTSTDAVIVSNYGVMSYRVNLDKWVTTPIGNLFMNTPTINVWIVGVFEVWLKVFSTSQTTQKAKWQSKSGVTTYKLYRDTASNLATKVLIYSGTDLQFIDTGLVTNTMYYYELEDQTNTEISRFNSKTK